MDFEKLKDILKHPYMTDDTSEPMIRPTRRVILEQEEKSWKENATKQITNESLIEKENKILESAIYSAHKRGLKVRITTDETKRQEYLNKLKLKKEEVKQKFEIRKSKNESRRKDK